MWKLKIAEGHGPWLITTNNHVGRQYWEFDPEAGTPDERAEIESLREAFKKNRFQMKQSADLLARMQLRKDNPSLPIPPPGAVKDTKDITEEAVTTTLRRAISYLSTIQTGDGHWPSDGAGPLIFLPPMIIALYITRALDVILSPEHKKEIVRYIYNHQNEDGGWGLHIESQSSVFGSTLNYVALRLLGEGPENGEDGAMANGRKWILDHGGAVGVPSWGKYWLAVLGAYDWAGCNPLPPELLLLPNFFPLQPGKLMCYGRLIYNPLSYLYGKRFVGPITELIQSLREEIYTKHYDEIDWNEARNTCGKEDLYNPHPKVQDMLWNFLYNVTEPILMRWPFCMLREKALKLAMEHVHYEDENSRYIGCVEKALSLIACWVEDPKSEMLKYHLARIQDYFWLAEDVMKLVSCASQTWDVAFTVRAIISSNLSEEYGPMLCKAHDYLKSSQIQENPFGEFSKMYRHISKGAWPFTLRDHGWQVSDCTAEGLKAALLLSQMPADLVGEEIQTDRLYEAVNFILSLQSSNGGFATWEPRRAFRFVENFNPMEFSQNIFIEQEYIECTSSVIQCLTLFQKLHPRHRRAEIERSLAKAVQYVEGAQNPDGSWYGYWGICHIYATCFAVEGLAASGKTYHNSPALRQACEFLISKELPEGGWGESYLSCTNKVYTNLEGGRPNVVQTSWALLVLIKAGQAEIDPRPIYRGLRVLINSQLEDGDFPQQELTGIFMQNCMMNYSLYRNIFPICALGEYRRRILFA